MSVGGIWLSACLMNLGSASRPYAVKKKKSEACSRWSCPLEVSLVPVMERVGSYSLHWALGLVQAAAVNEPRCSLLCHAGGFWLAVYLASVLSARVSAWDQRGNWEAGWQCEGSSSISLSMRAVEKADMLTQLCLYSARFSSDRLNKDWKLLPLIPSNQGRLMMMEFPFCLSCNIGFFFFLIFFSPLFYLFIYIVCFIGMMLFHPSSTVGSNVGTVACFLSFISQIFWRKFIHLFYCPQLWILCTLNLGLYFWGPGASTLQSLVERFEISSLRLSKNLGFYVLIYPYLCFSVANDSLMLFECKQQVKNKAFFCPLRNSRIWKQHIWHIISF